MPHKIASASHKADRKDLGAFYTPKDLATFVARWLITDRSMRVLEPAFGAGALLDAILKRFEELGSGDVVGIEFDRRVLAKAKAKYQSNARLLHGDFFSKGPRSTGLVDAVLANPPYTRNHALSPMRRAALKELAANVGVTGAPGLWVYFLCHSLKFLRPNGRIAFILPGAASFAHYSRPMLKILASNFSKVELVHVCEQVEWEGNAQERPVLLFASGYQCGQTLAIRQYNITRNLAGEFEAAPPTPPVPLLPHVELGKLAKIEIGSVTGSNRHFLVNASFVRDRDIQASDVTPTVARARHISGLTTRVDELESLAENGERTLLLTPPNIDRNRKGLRSWLATISKQQRRSTRWFLKRRPWWRVNVGQQADAVFTYMNHTGPRLSLIEPGTAVTNTLHKVYFNDSTYDRIRAICVSMLSTYTQLHAEKIGRAYGGGVLKFEICDARQLPVLLPDRVDMSTFARVDMALRSGAFDRARQLADEAILPFFCGGDWKKTQAEMEDQLTTMRGLRSGRPPNKSSHVI